MSSLTLPELEQRLDEALELDLVRLSPEQAAKGLAPFSREQQERALHWSKIAAQAHVQIGQQVSIYAATALGLMSDEVMGRWVYHALDLYDRKGLFPAVEVIKSVAQYAEEAEARARGVEFDESATMLGHFVQGLSGRRLLLEEGESHWTDSEKIYLPPFVGDFEQRADNFQLYKAQLVTLWAENWYGTWRLVQKESPQGETVQTRISQWLAPRAMPERDLLLLQRLEIIRIDAQLQREFPGIYRERARLLQLMGTPLLPAGWEYAGSALNNPEATLETSLLWLDRIDDVPPPRLCYQGVWQIDALNRAAERRAAQEQGTLQYLLWKVAEELQLSEPEQQKAKFEWRFTDEREQREGAPEIELLLEDQPVAPPEMMSELVHSIIQDFGELPPEYLHPAGGAAFDPDRTVKSAQNVWGGTYHEEGAFLYDEWDGPRLNYRKEWTVLREMEAKMGDLHFVTETINKYHRLVGQLRKSFEALRSADLLLKRQQNGDNLDVDAVVDAMVDHQQGREMTDRLYLQNHRHDRSIAVMIMVDMSGSTKGWINDAERESLVLLCEALETLDDRYAIYGFSGWTRKRCEVFPIKTFEQPYDDGVKQKIAGIEAQDYTRMGVAIRHLSKLLNEAEARTRLLITLSDGKPDDSDGYNGGYAIEDTRMALLEARRSGIHPFCITIDREGQEYLPHMYGPAGYTVVDAVDKLPLKVADIYRRLTL
ncbi:MAG: nitric oxide reductase activation protein [Gammaproteobacteria bacterium]|jgi:nitric oxide reductase NorD protein|nr:nitric oxide reductase activation protein [Gammaproteobacteria bacterium]MBT4606257.1 nitric oxide reductase activation protein [Thiotrichales bacterium]MBT6669967.1 nitric oxide reductase activation protein [Gammaproteobacteria bacterium]MBT8008132.1 nitric oxide reductase activation protein [Gammaproteobacteria bacterium]